MRLARPRAPLWMMKLSWSPSQKLECSACDFEVSSVEISAPYSPWNSFGNSTLSTFAFGASTFMAASKSFQESWPQA